jgi:hypothetical protein
MDVSVSTTYNTECIGKYNNFICSGKKKDLEECNKYFEEYINKMNFHRTENIEYGECQILNTRKDDKYIHSYNIDSIVQKIQSLTSVLPSDYYNNFMDLFDVTPRDNCCNCISIVLYSTNQPYRLSMYLPNILISLKNIEKYLPNWILRLYLDRSVFELIYKEEYNQDGTKKSCDKFLMDDMNFNLGCEYRKILNKIFQHPNCEVYLSLCSNIIKKRFKMESLRSQRFYGFFDTSVNINACREADGIISVFDCHNLKTMETNDVIFHMYPFNRKHGYKYFAIDGNNLVVNLDDNPDFYNQINNITLKSGEIKGITPSNIVHDTIYSDWHYYYKKYKTIYDIYKNDTEVKTINYVPYYQTFTILMPILAGLFALRCKLKQEIYTKCVLSLRRFIDIDFVNMFGINGLTNDEETIDYDKIHNKLLIGYDELVLMTLFEPIFGTTYEKVDNKIVLYNAIHILDMIGLSIPNAECKSLNYNNSVDLSIQMSNEPEYRCVSKETLKTLNIKGITYNNNFYEIQSIVMLMCFDKLNEYEKYNDIINNKFIYPSSKFIDILNFSTTYIDSNDTMYKFMMSFYDIMLFDDDYYKKKYLKYKSKYLKLKNT